MTPLPAMLLNSVLVMIAVKTCLWLLSLARRDASSVDPFWGTGFVVVTWFTLTGDSRRASAHSVLCASRTLRSVSKFQPQRWRCRARLLPAECGFKSDKEQRLSHAKFSRNRAARMRDSSSQYVTSRHPRQVCSRLQ